MSVRGLDVSNWQGRVDWAKVAADGIAFAWCKATEGTDFTDGWWERNRAEAAKHGVRVGGYHFARPGNSPLSDARHFLSVAKPKPGELLPVLDLERTDGKSAPVLRAWAAHWLEYVHHEIGARPVFYSYPYFITGSMGGAQGFGGYPLWLAAYGPNDGDRHVVQVVGPWHHIAVHQYTSHGRVNGVPGDCDLNVLVGSTLDELTYRGKEANVPDKTVTPAPQPDRWKRTLVLTSPYMRGEDVRDAQKALSGNRYGDFYDGLIDGEYGPVTATAAREAQRMLGYLKPRPTYGQGLHRLLTGTAKPTVAMEARRKLRLRQAKKVSLGQRALDVARAQIGTKEQPPGTNIARPYTPWYGWHGWGAPWCAVFVSWCLVQAGSKAPQPGKRWAYCPYMVADAVAGRNGLRVVKNPKPGDVVLYDWQERGLAGIADHVGLFERWDDGQHFVAVEGNTAVGNDSNGGQVMRRNRRRSQVVCFARVTR